MTFVEVWPDRKKNKFPKSEAERKNMDLKEIVVLI